LFTRCETEADYVKLPEFEKKLVVTSFISPSDTVSYVIVSSNQRLYGEAGIYESPGNISGTISDGTKEVSLYLSGNRLNFDKNEMQVSYGKNYTLKVYSDLGLSAEGECSVPEKRELTTQIDTFSILHKIDNYLPWREFKVTVSFTDKPDVADYYRLTGMYLLYNTNQGYEKRRWKEPMYIDKAFINDSEAGQDNMITRTFGANRYFSYYDSAFMKIYILHTEKSYYQYHKSLQSYTSGDNPFSEVTPVFSNIKGGLGVFSSYTIDSLTFRLK
jgi:hypothetical protein